MDTHYSFLTRLSGWPGRADIVLAVGNNNVGTEDTADQIVFQLTSLIRSIRRHNSANRIVIASLLFAPKEFFVNSEQRS